MHAVAVRGATALVAAATWFAGSPEAAATPPGPAPGSVAPRVLWHRPEQGQGAPVVDAGVVYFLTRTHEVLAADAATGRTRWRRQTGEPGAATMGTAVAVAGDVVIAGDYNLVAFDRTSGEPRWRFMPVVGHAPGLFLGQEAAGLVFTGSGAGRLHAVRAASGEPAWSARLTPAEAASVFAPVTDGRVVVAAYSVFGRPATTGGLGCVEAATGRLLWRTEFERVEDPLLGTGAAGGPVLLGDVAAAVRGDGVIFGFDLRTGAVRWTLPAIDTVPAILRGPLPVPEPRTSPDIRPLRVVGGLLVAGSLKGDVVAWDLRTLRERWHFLDPSLGSVVFAVSGDRDALYVPFGAGIQVALDAATGRERWRTPSGAYYFWPAAADGRRVFMGGEGGVHAVWR